jgi:hypothetical protein
MYTDMRREKNKDLQTAKSLYKEYQKLLKRAQLPGLPKCEVEYTMNMVYHTKSKINFDLLENKKKERWDYERRW